MTSEGFSLLELLVIVCLITILGQVGLLSWREMQQREQLTQTTKELVSFLNEVQVKANTSNLTYNLYLFSSPWCLAAKSGEKPLSCQTEWHFVNPYQSVEISGLTDKKIISFWGRRNMAQTAQFQLQNKVGISQVIISFRSRVRACSLNTDLSGIPKC